MDSINYSSFGGLLNKDTATLVKHYRSLHKYVSDTPSRYTDAAHYEAVKRGNEYEGRKLRDLSKEINDRFQLPEASLRVIREQELTRRVREKYAAR